MMQDPDPNLEPPPDPELAERFRELRHDDGKRVPPFAVGARRPRSRAVWIGVSAFAGAGALAAAAGAVVLFGSMRSAPEATPPPDTNLVPTVTIVRLDPPPLDFLLQSPQADFLGQSPTFDVAPVQEPTP